jgi:NADPH2:quinone reductase
MKAILVEKSAAQTALRLTDLPEPVFGPDDVVIRTAAAGVNRADLLQREGKYPPPTGASDILGLEVAGEITEAGDNVSGWKIGDRVCALLPGGGYASSVVCPQQMLLPVPADWSMIQAAAFPEAYFTAYLNLIVEGALKRQETTLIHGAASGVGTAAIQLAKIFGGTVLATCGSEEKAQSCSRLGADYSFNYRSVDFADEVEARLGKRSVDLILDPVGGSYFEKNTRLLAMDGRLVLIATLGGSSAQIDLKLLLRNRLKIVGSTLRNRPQSDKIELRNRVFADLWPHIAADRISPVIDSSFSASEAEAAHSRMLSNANIGKIVITF